MSNDGCNVPGHNHLADSVPRIYSPSQTVLWDQCALKRTLHYQKWVSRIVGKRDLAAMLGQAVGTGLADHYQGVAAGGAKCSTGCLADGWSTQTGMLTWAPSTLARTAAEQLLAALVPGGRRIEPWDQAQADALPMRAARAVERYIDSGGPIPPEWRILAVEETLPSGVARPDLVVDDGRGPTPLDFKTRLTLKPEYLAREQTRWQTSWQLYHYAWELKADHYYICLLVLEPRFRAELYPFEIHPQTLQRWELSAKAKWAAMQAEDENRARPAMAAQHTDAFGDCEYLKACFRYRLDPEKMAQDYVGGTT